MLCKKLMNIFEVKMRNEHMLLDTRKVVMLIFKIKYSRDYHFYYNGWNTIPFTLYQLQYR